MWGRGLWGRRTLSHRTPMAWVMLWETPSCTLTVMMTFLVCVIGCNYHPQRSDSSDNNI